MLSQHSGVEVSVQGPPYLDKVPAVCLEALQKFSSRLAPSPGLTQGVRPLGPMMFSLGSLIDEGWVPRRVGLSFPKRRHNIQVFPDPFPILPQGLYLLWPTFIYHSLGGGGSGECGRGKGIGLYLLFIFPLYHLWYKILCPDSVFFSQTFCYENFKYIAKLKRFCDVHP